MDEIEALALAAAAAKKRQAVSTGQPNPDGTYGQPPEGFFLDPRTGAMTSRELLKNHVEPSQGMAAAGGTLQGMAFGGFDEMVGGLGYLEGGADMANLRREQARAALEAGAEAFPKTDLAARFGGAVVPALAGWGALKAAPTVVGRMMTGLGLGAGAGATQGFMEGEGGLENRAWDALGGAAVGGVLGAAIPAGAAAAGQLWRGASGAFRDARLGNRVARDLGVKPETGRVVSALIDGENPGASRAALDRLGPDAMLADASPEASSMLDMAMKSPAPGGAIARQRVDDRAGEAYYGVVDALTGGKQGPRLPPVAAQRTMADSARGKIHPLYQKAYNTPIDYSAPEGMAIEDLMRKVPQKVARQAVEKAKDRMVYDGVPADQIMASIGADGTVTFTEMPNVMMLDYMKRAFDEIANDGKDAVTGKLNSDGAFAAKIAKDLRDAVGDAVPEYRQALAAAATDIRGREAVRTGQALLRPQTTVEDAAEAIADATPAELRAMREGVLGQIEHIMGNVRAVASDQNVDAREALKIYSELSSRNAKSKMQALFKDEWPAIEESIDKAGAALGLRARVAGNSATQPRMAAEQMIADEVAPGAFRKLEPLASLRQIGQYGLKSDPASVARLSRDVKAELADVLTRQGGDAQGALSAVVKALARNPVNPQSGSAIEKALGIAGFTGLPSQSETVGRRLGLLSAR